VYCFIHKTAILKGNKITASTKPQTFKATKLNSLTVHVVTYILEVTV
jgi:hypothetical protein